MQVDAIGIGLANAAAQFLPVFLTRLGATNYQVGLLTAMPATTGLFLSIVVGRFLQTRRQIVPWFSLSRLLVISSYTLTGVVPFLVPQRYTILAILLIWMLATLPQIVVNVSFSVVMNAVAGPGKRYDLMSRRWSLLGLTSAITVAIIGQVLERISFPVNYQVVFMGLSTAGLISDCFSSQIQIPDADPPPRSTGLTVRQRLNEYLARIFNERPFVSFTIKRFLYLSGQALAAPLFPLYYVREVNATDSWIGIFAMAQTSVTLVGYFFWTRQSRQRGSRFVLLWTTFGTALYPAVIATTEQFQLIAFYSGLAGILQAGIDLVFFDELMKTVPPEYSATFVSWAQSVQYLSSMAGPLLGTLLANLIGISGALFVSAGIRLIGFSLFAFGAKKAV